MVCLGDGDFEVGVADVEVEKTMLSAVEVEQAAVVSAPFHAAAE